jgi:hypothetical protein
MGMGESDDQKHHVPCRGPSCSVDALTWPAIKFAIPSRWVGFDFIDRPLPLMTGGSCLLSSGSTALIRPICGTKEMTQKNFPVRTRNMLEASLFLGP